MSQDGSWAEPDPARLDELERAAGDLTAVVAALVVKCGEPCGPDGRSWRLALTEAELMAGMGGTLRTNLDPASGALLIRFHPA